MWNDFFQTTIEAWFPESTAKTVWAKFLVSMVFTILIIILIIFLARHAPYLEKFSVVV
jgi:ABC-type enterobactin transport system permease subunit